MEWIVVALVAQNPMKIDCVYENMTPVVLPDYHLARYIMENASSIKEGYTKRGSQSGSHHVEANIPSDHFHAQILGLVLGIPRIDDTNNGTKQK
jgi:hypothetical protein